MAYQPFGQTGKVALITGGNAVSAWAWPAPWPRPGATLSSGAATPAGRLVRAKSPGSAWVPAFTGMSGAGQGRRAKAQGEP